MAHTPGPWQVGLSNNGTVVRAGECEIARIFDVRRFGADGNVDPATQGIPQANARLIAAAPGLRDALAALVQMFHARPDMLRLCGFHEHALIKAACDALNRAEPGP